MLNKLVCLFSQIIFFTACVTEKPDIRAICETNDVGDYILKWETFPQVDGTVKIYEMDKNDGRSKIFVTEQPVKNGITTIFGDESSQRRCFELVFNKKHSIFVAERHIKTQNIYNFRDIGGYYNKEGRQIKWGKIYRSGTLAGLSEKDIDILNSLNINTVVDFRNEQDIKKSPCRYKAKQVVDLPIEGSLMDNFKEKIIRGEMMRGDVLIMQQDLYINLLKNNVENLNAFFDILLDEKNYPVVIHSSLGKDQVGLATLLILLSLDVNKDQITGDFMLSNRYINFQHLVSNASELSYEMQEALTALLGTNETVIDYVYKRIVKDYGSVDTYLEKRLLLNKEKREQLKDLLLY